jgi:glycerol-3-phosphate dehydrogenase (NAD(P)+)
MKKNITVLGAGSWGTALAIHFARQGHQVCLWGKETQELQQMQQTRCNTRYLPDTRFPESLIIQEKLAVALQDTDAVLLVVPSSAFHKVITEIKPYLNPGVLLMWGTKGLDNSTNPPQLLHQSAQSILGKDQPRVVLSGPSFAKEVAQGLPTAVAVSGTSLSAVNRAIEYFHSHTLRFYRNDDLVGVQLAAVMKNILAVATGISDGLGLGYSARAALISRGLAELTGLGVALGGQAKTFSGLAGVGDLVLTCTSDLSRNRRFGLALGQGLDQATAIKKIGQVVESLDHVKEIYRLSQIHQIDMPITEQVYRILFEQVDCQSAVTHLLNQPPKSE